MKVSSRLGWGFGSLLALLLLIVAVGLFRLAGIHGSMNELLAERLPNVERLDDIAYRTMDNARVVRNLILLTDDKQMAANKAVFDKNLAVIAEAFDQLDKQIRSQEGRALLAAMKEARAAYGRFSDEVVALGLANRNDEGAQVLFGEGYKTQGIYLAAIQKLKAYQRERMAATSKVAEDSFASARTTLLVVGALACLLGIALALLITRSLVRQLGGEPADASEIARAVADGDLARSIPLKAGDRSSLMASLAAMQAGLAKVVGTVRSNADSVATAGAQIAQGNTDLSQRTEEQASALQHTAASMEQLGSTVKQNADNARQANQLAQGASAVATKGGEVVGQVVATMKGINDASRKIADIIAVIDGIAFQTNILALNAAVEAARAGEQGRGFAVVAGEVRTLAQRSAEAAKEIKSLINASVERVEQGSALVDQAGATMQEIVGAIQRVTDIMGEISSASAEQSAGVAQIGQTVAQMDQATQQNAALVEESAAAAESLKHQAQQLVQAVSVFKLAHGVQPVAAAMAPVAMSPAVSPAAATAAAPGWHGEDRRGPGRATNVSRPAFKRVARPDAAAAGAAATAATAADAGAASAVAPAAAKTGTNDEWTSF